MRPPFHRHIFICTNRRPEGSPRGCCASKDSEAVRFALKAELERRGCKVGLRVNESGCLGTCPFGVSLVIYPEGIWYGGVSVDKVPMLVEEHFIQGKTVESLVMPFIKKSGR